MVIPQGYLFIYYFIPAPCQEGQGQQLPPKWGRSRGFYGENWEWYKGEKPIGPNKFTWASKACWELTMTKEDFSVQEGLRRSYHNLFKGHLSKGEGWQAYLSPH